MISVVILTFNSEKYISACLDSIFSQNGKKLEVIVVDNGSKDKTKECVKKHPGKPILIENQKNFGPCLGRNIGIKQSRGDWILTLDCDITLEKGFFKNIKQHLKNTPENIGMLQPKILNANTSSIYSCGVQLCWSRRFYDIGANSTVSKFASDSLKHVFGCCAAAAFYRRSMLEQLCDSHGYFDERFFFFVEDVDLAWRAQKKGWRALFMEDASCFHIGNSSTYDPKLRQFLCFRNRAYTIFKNEGLIKYAAKLLPLLCYDFPRFMYLMMTNPYMRRRNMRQGVLPGDG
ncbi:MAG: glycosyltransferase family 2 protein [Candidatus Omnitrophica bacterium]|nr:glycosyltransferase family 2 protein [Candidatus Omnitrophota bacterium]